MALFRQIADGWSLSSTGLSARIGSFDQLSAANAVMFCHFDNWLRLFAP
jgi:hypothetical protein